MKLSIYISLVISIMVFIQNPCCSQNIIYKRQYAISGNSDYYLCYLRSAPSINEIRELDSIEFVHTKLNVKHIDNYCTISIEVTPLDIFFTKRFFDEFSKLWHLLGHTKMITKEAFSNKLSFRKLIFIIEKKESAKFLSSLNKYYNRKELIVVGALRARRIGRDDMTAYTDNDFISASKFKWYEFLVSFNTN
ncbi:MAG: hypothetical protein PHU33_09745 [Bacteroidales bacterium]|nr:hypothetical protein [Bacteroidales bacterium]